MSIFTDQATTKVQKNTFDLSHDRKFSTKMGQLTPILVMDVIPGDQIRIQGNAMVRFAPMIAPPMHMIDATLHYFYVPLRLLEDGSTFKIEEFLYGGQDGTASPVWPHIDYDPSTVAEGSLYDYLGLPTASGTLGTPTTPLKVSAYPLAAYQKIYDDYYRDQNQIGELSAYKLQAGSNNGNLSELSPIRRRAWEHDYFTSLLPWPQRGPESLLPLGTSAEIELKDLSAGGWTQLVKNHMGSTVTTANGLRQDAAGIFETDAGGDRILDLNGTHFADLSTATASSINDLRRAFALQTWLEKNARGGARLVEGNYIHFGKRSSDKRLQRAEYLGGVKVPIKVSEIVQSSNAVDQTTPQGNLAGHGVGISGGSEFGCDVEEHGYIIGIMSVMPRSAYSSQGIPRHFLREDRFLYPWPTFAHIGEQPVYSKEIVISESDSYNESILGYTPRYSEMKFINSSVHGDYRSSLDFWHLARKFSSEVFLNQDFLEMDWQEVDRIFAVQDGSDNLWCHIMNNIKATRPLPRFGTPKIQ